LIVVDGRPDRDISQTRKVVGVYSRADKSTATVCDLPGRTIQAFSPSHRSISDALGGMPPGGSPHFRCYRHPSDARHLSLSTTMIH
jgi:hypothetical protein